MRHALGLTTAVLLLLGPSLASAQAPAGPAAGGDDEDAFLRGVQVTRWADPTTRPDTYLDYLAARARAGHALDAPFSAQLAYRSPPDVYQSRKRLDVLLESALYKDLALAVGQYLRDLEIEGWGVTLWRCEGGKPAEVRAFLQARRQKDAVLGCLMVGDLPVAWYEMDDDWNNRHSEFPSDLYYMDLDGAFGDRDQDGKFDSHTATPSGDPRPDIFVGRLRPSPLTAWGTPAALLQNYFRKVHAYRTGALSAPERALAYQDDDWYRMRTYQEQAFGHVVTVSDKYTTTAADYQARLKESYASVIVCAHSSPTLHAFKKPGGRGGTVTSSTLWSLDPPCLFYNLFACSSARYTTRSYLGGVYIFVKSLGLLAVGTTKTGSMLYFLDYYAELGRHHTFGEAFRSWFARRYPYSLYDRRWFYGMTLLGDPTLRISRASLRATYTSSGPGKGFTVDFLVSGRPDHAGDRYGIMGAQTGTVPGFTFPGVRVPLDFDLFSWFFLFALNSPAFPNSFGTLDATGHARARFIHQGAIPRPLLGKQLYFSALVLDARTLDLRLATPPAAVTLKE